MTNGKCFKISEKKTNMEKTKQKQKSVQYYKTILIQYDIGIKTDTYIDQWNRMESTKINPHIWLIYDK